MITYNNHILNIFVGTEPLFCVLHFMEITWLLGPGTKVLKVGHVMPSFLPCHSSTTVLNLTCMWPIHLLRYFIEYIDCKVFHVRHFIVLNHNDQLVFNTSNSFNSILSQLIIIINYCY